MESTVFALGTSNDWYLLKLLCRENMWKVKFLLFFKDQWLDIQKSHLNQCKEEIKFIFYHDSNVFTNLDFHVDKRDLGFNPVKKFLAKFPHKKYVEWTLRQPSSRSKILIELDFLSCPRTCENFLQLSLNTSPPTYLNSKLHRSVKTCFIEGGLLPEPFTSIYGDYFPDENFRLKHDKAGVLGMVKSETGLNGARFYITLKPIEYFDGKLVAFGRVVEGMDVIRQIANLATSNQVITEDVIIEKCEEFMSKGESVEDMRKTGGFSNFLQEKSNGFRDLANELLKFV